jgi:hypothetical protein
LQRIFVADPVTEGSCRSLAQLCNPNTKPPRKSGTKEVHDYKEEAKKSSYREGTICFERALGRFPYTLNNSFINNNSDDEVAVVNLSCDVRIVCNILPTSQEF